MKLDEPSPDDNSSRSASRCGRPNRVVVSGHRTTICNTAKKFLQCSRMLICGGQHDAASRPACMKRRGGGGNPGGLGPAVFSGPTERIFTSKTVYNMSTYLLVPVSCDMY